jgi:hypothetical protein
MLDPQRILQVPLDSSSQARSQVFSRLPTEFLLNFTGIHGVPPVVARAVLNKCNKRRAWSMS